MRKCVESVMLAVVLLGMTVGFLVALPERVRADPTVDYVMVVDAPGGAGSWVASRDYTFGDNDTFWAAGYNASSGWVQDVPVYWQFTESGLARGNQVIRVNHTYGSSAKIYTNGYGIAHVRAYYHITPGNLTTTNDTGPLRVSVDNVDSVIVRSEQGGAGTWVGPATYQSGDKDKFYAAAYDSGGNFLDDIVSNWTSTNLSVGYLYSSPSGRIGGCEGSGTTVSCYPLINFYASAIGHTYVNATPVGTSVTNMTGKLTVTGVGVDYIQIRDAPNGHGQVRGNFTYYEREQDTFYAASYNFTIGYRGEVTGDWTTNDSAVCKVKGYSGNNAHGSSVQLLLVGVGNCTVTVNATTISGVISNTTGTLTVLPRTTLTVDANGGKDYTTIQAAVDAAGDGYTIEVYPAIYYENVVVNKEIEIVGTDRTGVILDGGGSGTALYLGTDRIVIHNFTILNAEYGIFNDQTNNTRIYHMTIKDYTIGLNNSYTLNAWVAYNLIRDGEIGVVAYKAYDDAIRYNEIAYNTAYGGKGYNAHLRNCFNWNSLHNNGIGYYYDPTTELPPMEFNGNVLIDNDIGVKVESSSAITVTGNSISGGSEGVQLLYSSSEVSFNTISGVLTGIRFHESSSNITYNTIVAVAAGIVGDTGSPRIEGNDITVTSGNAMDLDNLDGAVIQGNNVHGGTIAISNSHVAVLSVLNSNVILTDTTVDSLTLDASSIVEFRHTVRVQAVDSNGEDIGGATVTVHDAQGNLAFSGTTGSDGFTPPFALTTGTQTSVSFMDHNPFSIKVSSGDMQGALATSVDASRDIVVTVSGGAGPWIIAIVAMLMLAAAFLAGALSIERSKYALFLFFLPLYTRLNHDKTLENYNRGRVFQYIDLNPGTHYNAILAALSINNGALVYHLDVLQREGMVTSRQEGMYRRFYPADMQPPPIMENGTTESQLRVLKAIQEMPGITQKELSKFLGLKQSTLAYQIDRLTAMGYVTAEKQGRAIHYTSKHGGN
jgi:DNA-binding transcriptional ArsR family regulator